MQIHVITAFPSLLHGPLDESIIKRARERNIVQIYVHDLRDFTTDKHRSVDDYPYGGGPGMVLKPEPIFRCVDHILAEYGLQQPRIILMTPQGERYTQRMAIALSTVEAMIIICGHYKGVDERVRLALVTDEISIGDYVLSGGELPAAVVIDSVVRLLPGAISDPLSAEGDSFHRGMLDHPHYTRPEEFRGMRVPEVLLSGNHAAIERWRREQALEQTRRRRKDLLQGLDNE
ncbi:MAG: tRNA (guanosine(37)-N1)-methyltransferase TrmD [Calditrichaeota bacterium]|nr:tRNA (guanosine(37)-N1)-methyltransferase TrmD [Calditrichota bacterium]